MRFFNEAGKPSGTKTVFSIVALVVAFRLAFAHVLFPPLDWVGVAAVLGALGAVYGGRRFTEAYQARKPFKSLRNQQEGAFTEGTP